MRSRLSRLRLAVRVAAVFALLAIPRPAFAWTVQGSSCGGAFWPGGTFTHRTSITHFPAGGGPHAAIESAAAMWNAGAGQAIRGASVTIVHGSHTTTTARSATDGMNTITQETLSPGEFGRTVSNWNTTTCEFNYADIMLNDLITYQTWPELDNNDVSYSTTMLHEVGHALGFAHEDDYADTMNTNPHGSALIGFWDRVGENARVGLRAQYGDNSTGVDLAVARFRYTGTAGSTEAIPDNTGCGTFENGVEKRNGVVDQTIWRCFCIHDLGTTTESGVTMKLYFSGDDSFIETTDTVAATWSSIMVAPNQPHCAARSFNVPNLAPGPYRIGVIIDPADTLAEYDETNNIASDWTNFSIIP